MAKIARFQGRKSASPDRVERPAIAVMETIKLLLSHLSQDEREQILSEIEKYIRPLPVEKAGNVLGTIVKFLPKKENWTVDEFKSAVKETGLDASPKEIYNAIGYLTRRGHIRRVGYGRYIVDGVEVVTADDLGGENARNEDDYRTSYAKQLAPKERK